MKFDKQKAFPYPVLRPSNDDYRSSEFQAMVDTLINESTSEVEFKISYALSSEDIIREIKKGNAQYVSIICCRDTYFRTVLATCDTKQKTNIEVGKLRGEVRIEPYIVVNKEIPSFKPSDLNSEFGSGPFSFSVGDVLAQDEAYVVFIDRDYFKPITSVFDLVKKDSLEGAEWTIGFDEDHIQIQVSPQMKEKIDNARNNQDNKVILINSIYFAAVMQAIQKLKDSAGEYDHHKWADVIRSQTHNNGWDIESEDAYLIAERLLQYPLALLDTYIFKGGD